MNFSNYLLYSYSSQYSSSYKSNDKGDFLVFFIILLVLAVCVCFGALANSEAKKQGRNNTLWFILGFFFSINAFIALKVSKAANEEGHSINLWSFFGVVFGIRAIMALESGVNAENKTHDFDCWAIVGFALGILGLFASCCLKSCDRNTVVKNQNAYTTTNPIEKNTAQTSSSIKNNISNAGWECPNCKLRNSYTMTKCVKCGTHKP